MKALMSSRPRRGACNEYCSSMSGAASSSTIAGLYSLPQKCVNQRPTTALLSSSLDMIDLLALQWAAPVCERGGRATLRILRSVVQLEARSAATFGNAVAGSTGTMEKAPPQSLSDFSSADRPAPNSTPAGD